LFPCVVVVYCVVAMTFRDGKCGIGCIVPRASYRVTNDLRMPRRLLTHTRLFLCFCVSVRAQSPCSHSLPAVVRQTRSNSYASKASGAKFPAVVSEDGRRSNLKQYKPRSSPDLKGTQESDEESSVSSLDSSDDSGTVATPLLPATVAAPRVPAVLEVSGAASLPARPSSSKKKLPKTPNTQEAKTPRKKSSTKRVDSSSSVRSKNPLRTNKGGLDPLVQQRVAQEIENNGGLVAFFLTSRTALHKLCEACSQDPEKGGVSVWGEKGSKRRTAIKDKTIQWRGFPIEEYHDIIAKIGVTNHLQLQTQTSLFGSPLAPKTITFEPTTEPSPRKRPPQPKMQTSDVGAGVPQRKLFGIV